MCSIVSINSGGLKRKANFRKNNRKKGKISDNFLKAGYGAPSKRLEALQYPNLEAQNC
jgi:hypothetical protein